MENAAETHTEFILTMREIGDSFYRKGSDEGYPFLRRFGNLITIYCDNCHETEPKAPAIKPMLLDIDPIKVENSKNYIYPFENLTDTTKLYSQNVQEKLIVDYLSNKKHPHIKLVKFINQYLNIIKNGDSEAIANINTIFLTSVLGKRMSR